MEEGEVIPPAPPFRPLPRIVARQITVEIRRPSKLTLGARVNVYLTPKFDPPFWRLYEVTAIDFDTCRLVSPDKKFAMNAPVHLVEGLLFLQNGDVDKKA